MERLEATLKNVGIFTFHKKHPDYLTRLKQYKGLFRDMKEFHRFFIHQDIKPDNLMIDKNGFLAFIDFGTGELVSDM